MRYAGELASLGTALCWSVGSNLFTAAGRRMGAVVLNRHRIVVAGVLLSLALWVTHGAPWPFWATRGATALLALSGIVGFVFGDTFFFRSLVILGPGRAGLLLSLSPLITAAIGWPLLGEHLGPMALLGMTLAVGGVSWVMLERGTHETLSRHGRVSTGIVAGLLAALGQSGGYVLSKLALRSGIDPLSANTIRIGAAAVTMWAFTAAQRQIGPTLGALRDRGATAFMLGGAILGPVVGVVLSLTALEFIEAGVAASIIAVYPILALAISSRFHGEPMTPRSLIGALVATAGVVVLFLR
jgi:drug/metabolite transporter (DMT)-like permease